MKERPILFSAPMVRAILEGRKTQTRRALKIQPIRCTELPFILFPQSRDEAIEQTGFIWPNAKEQILALCPYGRIGDRLWVREAHAPQTDCWGAWTNWNIGDCKGPKPIIHYRADGGLPWVEKWRPSIHMPRWASRINLEITGVRVERLTEISDSGPANDCTAEGVFHCGMEVPSYEQWNGDGFHSSEKWMYRKLWEDINGAGSWEANPWVWVVEFKRVMS